MSGKGTYRGGSSLVGAGQGGRTHWKTFDDAGVPTSDVIGPHVPTPKPKPAPKPSTTMEQHRRRMRSISAYLSAVVEARLKGEADPPPPKRLASEVEEAGGLSAWLKGRLIAEYLKKAEARAARRKRSVAEVP